MKRHIKQIVVICLMAMLVLGTTITFASSEVPTNQTYTDSENDALTQSLMQMQIQRGDRYIAGDTVVVDELIDGNLFVAGNNVTIKSAIAGDIFVVANSVTIDAQVYQNAYICANKITLNGLVMDLYSSSSSLMIGHEGVVYRDLHAINGSTTILGNVGRNASLEVKTLSLGDAQNHGTISGNLDYTANTPVQAPQGSVIGSVSYTETLRKTIPSVSEYLTKLAINISEGVLVVVAIWLVSLLVGKEFNKKSSILVSKKLLSTIGMGLLAFIGIPAICLCIMLIPGCVRIGLLGLLLYVFLLIIAVSISCIAIANYFAKQCKKPTWYKTLILVVVISYVLILLKNLPVPYFPGILTIILVVIGLGTLISNIFYKGPKKEVAKPSSVIEELEQLNSKPKATANSVIESDETNIVKEETPKSTTTRKTSTKPKTTQTAKKSTTKKATSTTKKTSTTKAAPKKTTTKTTTKKTAAKKEKEI